MAYIGRLLKERLKALDMTEEQLAKNVFMDINEIVKISKNQVSIDEIDEFDLSLICSALHCTEGYFTDINERKNDLLFATINRGEEESSKSRQIKLKIQSYIKDLDFLNEIEEYI